jgi:hypothetical protein
VHRRRSRGRSSRRTANERPSGTRTPPLEYDTHSTVNNRNGYVVPPRDDDVIGGGVIHAGPKDNDIEPFAHEPVVSDERGRDWAEEMDEEVRLVLQGEYMHSSYSQQPAPPSPAPWSSFMPYAPTDPPPTSLPVV